MPKYLKELNAIRNEIKKAVIGQDDVINGLLRAILANGHVLIEGVPGIAKTLLIRSLAASVGCSFSRIQFTVDLLPSDITGMTTYTKGKGFDVIKGPIFSNFIIADEINRSPPKTQSALLEAMQEKQATIGKTTYKLKRPFFVMANNNPLESSGVYPLPEAQIDRFLFKLKMEYPSELEVMDIIENNMTLKKFEDFKIRPVVSGKTILEMQEYTKKIKHTEKIKEYIVKIAFATRFPEKYNISSGKYIDWGISPRGEIGLFIAAKADAVLNGQEYVTPQNVKNVAYDIMRHRLILNYQARADRVSSEYIISEILSKIDIP
ncbi:MoxR family ATPase [Candidatus Woesearchaeota archaeon]|nr:MAG: MoxR family ATPase [Candidatus Woesearchaeota archaeon]